MKKRRLIKKDSQPEKRKRQDTKLESTGAEFLVLGNLLLRGVSAYKSYLNFPGYDLVAVNPDKNLSVRIQVKSRYHTNWDGFIINNFDCDFVILAILNRGFKKVKKDGNSGIKDPEYFIFPIEYVGRIRDKNNKWGKITKGNMREYSQYLGRWELIQDFLKDSDCKYQALHQTV